MEKKRSLRLPLVILVLIALIVVVYVLYQPPSGEGSPPASKSPGEAAEQGLVTFPALITEENYAVMGFGSVEEVASARLGEPLQVFYVPLNQLKEYQPGSDVESLLVNSDRVYYPVNVDEQLRSTIVVSGTNDDWRATEYGNPNLMRALAEVREGGEEFVVWVPALNLYFIGFRSDDILFLTPIQSDTKFKFRAGGTLSAEEVFARIQPAAEDQEDVPTS